MPSHRQAKVAFASALVLLILSGGAAYVSIARLLESEKWVIHTYQVQAALGDLDSNVAQAGRARTAFITTGNENFLREFESALATVPQKFKQVRDLTLDNPSQTMACDRLEVVTWQRIALFRRSIALKQEDLERQAEITGDSVPLATETTALTEQMRGEETRLLAVRVGVSHRRFVLAIVVLSIAFVLALIMFLIYYRLLSEELDARQQAERMARQGEDALRFLTGRLLRLQDEERRKISRELHDSLGQSLVGVKMHLEILARKHAAEDDLGRCISLIDQSIGEMRTISHLMHPPLLDEVGFAPAAKWYVAGFSQRSGIEVSLQMPEAVARLPHTVELSLFRILQEGLTNIHRHSHSTRAEIVLKIKESQVILKIKDYGTGISQEALNRFRSTGASVGVGMAGMRERVREIAGQIEIQSNGTGTLISVTMPLSDG